MRGISIGNALKRKKINADFYILSSCPFAYLVDVFGFKHIEIPQEDEKILLSKNYKNSELFKSLNTLKPDILIIDLLWFPLYYFLDKLSCKTIFLWQTMKESFFTIPLPGGSISYKPEMFDLNIAIEPFKGAGPEKQVNPLILRNKNEILSRKEALSKLGLKKENHKNCLLAYNGHSGDFERVKKMYCYLEDEGYDMIYTTNYKGGIFPIVDYFNAFDLIICGASYNSFWEARFFNKEAIFIPTQTRFVDTSRLLNEYIDYSFSENGADQLADIISGIN